MSCLVYLGSYTPAMPRQTCLFDGAWHLYTSQMMASVRDASDRDEFVPYQWYHGHLGEHHKTILRYCVLYLQKSWELASARSLNSHVSSIAGLELTQTVQNECFKTQNPINWPYYENTAGNLEYHSTATHSPGGTQLLEACKRIDFCQLRSHEPLRDAHVTIIFVYLRRCCFLKSLLRCSVSKCYVVKK